MTPQGGSARRLDSQWASRAPEELREMVSARMGWGTQRAAGVPSISVLLMPLKEEGGYKRTHISWKSCSL